MRITLFVFLAFGLITLGCTSPQSQQQASSQSCPQLNCSACKTQCPQCPSCIVQCPQCPECIYNETTCAGFVNTITVTKYVCQNGTVVNNLSSCQSKITQTPPSLSLAFVSASDTTRYIHDPTITLTNNGQSAVNNLVFDVETDQGGQLIEAETDVYCLAGSTSVVGVNAGQSVRCYLNYMVYSGTNSNFGTGSTTVKVTVRQGADATPLATAEKTISIS